MTLCCQPHTVPVQPQLQVVWQPQLQIVWIAVAAQQRVLNCLCSCATGQDPVLGSPGLNKYRACHATMVAVWGSDIMLTQMDTDKNK